MNFCSSFKAKRLELGLNQSQAADQFGVKQKTISNWESGRNEPNIDTLQRISSKWAISIDYLLGINVPAVNTFHNDLILIPEYDQQLSAGLGSHSTEQNTEIGFRPFPKVWIEEKGLDYKSLKLLRVKGESMEPLLKDKDIVMVDTSKTNPTETMPFAIRLDDELFVKGIQRQGEGNLLLVSRNEAYTNIRIHGKTPPNDFAILGAVVWHAHSWV